MHIMVWLNLQKTVWLIIHENSMVTSHGAPEHWVYLYKRNLYRRLADVELMDGSLDMEEAISLLFLTVAHKPDKAIRLTTVGVILSLSLFLSLRYLIVTIEIT